MVNMTIAVPPELHQAMKKHNDIKWSEVARNALWDKARRLKALEEMDKILAKSTLTEKDAEEIGRKIKREIAKDHGLL